MSEADKKFIEELAERIGMNPLDVKLQEGVTLAKHIEECPKCANLLNYCNEKISSHAKETLK